ncbi:GBF1 [Blepharisma stoltei]|uniref:SEC7 domain-containing protein n=1 Tax=Blepharisma stoltei TaxID=1481888 RepID=A0AAU9IVW8_9CILI|nr:unnamed protein product [Blepharisma stoltei]
MNNRVKTINCVKGEIHNLLAIMRFVPDFTASPEIYIAEFKSLFQSLLVCSDVDSLDFWSPFLKIIQSTEVAGPIVGVALSSIHKFLLYGFLSPTSGFILNNIVNSVVQWNIPGLYSSNDEVIFMKLLQVFLECLRTQASIYLTDASVWSIVKRCFDVFDKERVSELLKKTAQNTLLQIFIVIFNRTAEMGNEECYGVPCVRNILLKLANLIGTNEKNEANWKEKRCLGLFLMNTALETAGEAMGLHEGIVLIIQDEVCKSLLINSNTGDLFILSLTLRVVFNLFQSIKRHLKVQLEVFFNSIHLKIASEYEDSQDPFVYQRSELALESIVDFCREPSLVLELYTNYDCDLHFANLFEALSKFLCKHAFPLHQNLIRLNELCLQGLLAITSTISIRCDPEMHNIEPEPLENKIKENKVMKEKYSESAYIFNNHPKDFIVKLQEKNYLPKNCDAEAVAKFLKENPAIDSTSLGEYLGKPGEFNQEVLRHYLKFFDYGGMRIDLALRLTFTSLKAPGEPQCIDRILDAFGKVYFQQNPEFADETASYVLAFSIIMLNTDLHSCAVINKMSIESYMRNVKGVNGGKDFPQEMLIEIYNSIKNEPIQVSETVNVVKSEDLADNDLANNTWKKIIKRTKGSMNYRMLNELMLQPAGENEKDMLDILWESGILGTLTNAMDCAGEEKSLKAIKELFIEISKICTYFNMTDHINRLLSTLCQCFLRNTDSIIAFHHSKRALYALEAAVECAIACKDHLNGVWGHLINCLFRLHSLKLLPQQLIDLDDFVDKEGRILPMSNPVLDDSFFQYFRAGSKVSNPPSHKSEDDTVEESSGLWASFAMYLGVPTQPAKRGDELMQELTQELREKVIGTGIHQIFLNTKSLPLESLNYLLRTLIQRCKDSNEEVNIVLSLELLTNSILSNAIRLEVSEWKSAIAHLVNVVTSTHHSWSTERGLVCLLRLCIHHHDDIVDLKASLVTVLEHMAELPPKKLSRYADRLAAGILILMNSGNTSFLIQGSSWTLLLKILNSFSLIERTAMTGFEIVSLIIHHLHEWPGVELKMYEELLDLIIVYIRQDLPSSGRISLGLKLVHSLHKQILKRNTSEVVIYFWKKILALVGRLCQEQKQALRLQAYTLLQEIILTSSSHPDLEKWPLWKECFERVLFPLVVEPFMITREMLKDISDEKATIMKKEFEMCREKAMDIICYAVLFKIKTLNTASEFTTFWVRLLKLLSQTLKNKESGDVNEKSYEMLKNLLLVLKTDNDLNQEQWTLTWEIINLDALRHEIEPETASQQHIDDTIEVL